MKFSYVQRTLVFMLIGSAILFFLYFNALHFEKLDMFKILSNQFASKKLFVYLIQTEQCIPDYFLTGNQLLGDPDECRRDVIVFSFKKKCLNSTLSHVQYIYSSAPTTLNTGKNLIYKAAQARNVDYLYYVFADDDVQLSYHEKYSPLK